MKNEKMEGARKMDGTRIWKQFEDLLVPRLRLSLVDRAVYLHLVRHSRLEGKARLHFSIFWLARGTLMSTGSARGAVRRLAQIGALRLVERSKAGHVVEMRVPEEIRSLRPGDLEREQQDVCADIEEMDFLESRALREAIHEREKGECFYCLRRLTARLRCIDHVVPRVLEGLNSYRNLVSACGECNSRKGERKAGDYLRLLYREGRLTSGDLRERLRALDELAAGRRRPKVGEGK